MSPNSKLPLWSKHSLVVAVMLALAIAGCGSSSSSSAAPTSVSVARSSVSSTSAPPTTAVAQPVVITIENFTFDTPIAVRPGATVTVKNADDTAHTVSATNGAFDTKPIFGGASTTFTAPAEPGSYKFHCNIHANMHGMLFVSG